MIELAFIPAGLLSAVFSLGELVNSRRRLPCWQTLGFVGSRLLIDAGAGALSYSLLKAAFNGVDWFTTPWQVLVAGLCGSALLRSQLALLGSGQEQAHYGPATVYTRLQKVIDSQIDDLDSAATEKWITYKVLPAITTYSPDQLAKRSETYLDNVGRLKKPECKKIKEYLSAVAADSHADEDDKRRTIIVKLIDSGGKRFVRRLMTKERSLPFLRPRSR